MFLARGGRHRGAERLSKVPQITQPRLEPRLVVQCLCTALHLLLLPALFPAARWICSVTSSRLPAPMSTMCSRRPLVCLHSKFTQNSRLLFSQLSNVSPWGSIRAPQAHHIQDHLPICPLGLPTPVRPTPFPRPLISTSHHPTFRSPRTSPHLQVGCLPQPLPWSP